MTGPPYLAPLLARLADYPLTPGRVLEVEVRHDEWCDLLAGRGPCNCEPEVELVAEHGEGRPA